MASIVLTSGDASVAFTQAAAENIEECGVDWASDLARLRDGTVDPQSLLESCIDGADEDRIAGWRDYVSDLALALKRPLRAEEGHDYRLAWDVAGHGKRGV